MPNQHIRKSYGWYPDLPDFRDKYLVDSQHWTEKALRLPPSIDLSTNFYEPPIYDQGQLGSCVSNGTAALFQFVSGKEGVPRTGHLIGSQMPSRLFIYHKAEMYEGDCNGDNGAQVRTGLKVIATVGVCEEKDYPYSTDVAQLIKPIPNNIFALAYYNKTITYLRLNQTLAEMQGCLAAGYPFVLGFTVYESFESEQVAETGIVPMPQPSEQVVGGHCVVCDGYNDTTQMFKCRNSWGTGWGQAGYFQMPYAYLTNSDLSSDFWTLRTVS